MALIERIVFPVDFSQRCDEASVFVAAIAGRFQARLVLLHVVEVPVAYVGSPELGAIPLEAVRNERLRNAEERLSSYLAAELKHLPVERAILEGDPARQIVDYAREHDVSLIMLPTHGFGPFRRFILGSVTAKVLHDAECPVWTAAHIDQPPPLEEMSIRRIHCAVDLAPQSAGILRWAAALAAEYMAELVIVNAEPMVESRPGKYLDKEFVSGLINEARAKLDQLKHEAGISAQVVVEAGEPAAVISRLAAEHGADLVCIGRGSAASGLGRLRANAYSIIRQSPCPVVSV